jgi:FtsZ-binding cell division protein ZapB
MKLQIKKLKSDVNFLKTKSSRFQSKAAKLETENKSLRQQIEAVKGAVTAPSLPLPPIDGTVDEQPSATV